MTTCKLDINSQLGSVVFSKSKISMLAFFHPFDKFFLQGFAFF